MDEETVRRHAEAHGRATVEGDLRAAGSDLTKDAMTAAGEVMKKLPASLSSSAIDGVSSEGDEYVVRIRYSGEDGDAVVESRWAEREGRPKIVDLEVV
jgi:hypothetical protein